MSPGTAGVMCKLERNCHRELEVHREFYSFQLVESMGKRLDRCEVPEG